MSDPSSLIGLGKLQSSDMVQFQRVGSSSQTGHQTVRDTQLYIKKLQTEDGDYRFPESLEKKLNFLSRLDIMETGGPS